MKETGQNSTITINLLEHKSDRALNKTIQEGRFQTEMKYVIEARGKWNAIMAILKSSRIRIQTRPAKALLELSTDPNFDWKTMFHKVEIQGDKIHHCLTKEGYIRMFRNIYNNRNSKPIG